MTDTRRIAGWLPTAQEDLEDWLEGHRESVSRSSEPLHPVIQRLVDDMANDPVLRMGVVRMVEQVPHGRQYRTRHVEDVDELLPLINAVLTLAPEYGDGTMVMLPLAGILDWTMSTPAGYAIYRDPRMNRWLQDLLAGDESIDRFVGGTVYQAFLSALDHHRWHSPVSGTVLRAFTVGGTYYSEADAEGSDADTATDSQGYLAHVSARAVVVIDADEPGLGQVAFIAVGMLEVSSCVIVRSGQHLSKGDELGYFQYGGSTHCLVFEPDAIEYFATAAIPQLGGGQPAVPVRSTPARARVF